MTKENKTSSISQDYDKSIKTYLLLIPYKLLIKQNSLVHMFNKFASNTKGYYLDFFSRSWTQVETVMIIAWFMRWNGISSSLEITSPLVLAMDTQFYFRMLTPMNVDVMMGQPTNHPVRLSYFAAME